MTPCSRRVPAPRRSSPPPGSLCADDGETTRPRRSSAYSVPHIPGRWETMVGAAPTLRWRCGWQGHRSARSLGSRTFTPRRLETMAGADSYLVASSPCPVRSVRSLRTVGSAPGVPFRQRRTFIHFRTAAWPFTFRRAKGRLRPFVRPSKRQAPSAKCKVLSAKCGAVGRRASRYGL